MAAATLKPERPVIETSAAVAEEVVAAVEGVEAVLEP